MEEEEERDSFTKENKLDIKSEELKQEVMKENFSRIKHKILVMSGKGGVGKSTVAVNLAYALNAKGLKIGILDIDLHGPSTAKMTGIEGLKNDVDEMGHLVPIKTASGVEIISMSSLLDTPDTPLIWRGPLKIKAINDFFGVVTWSELDYLIIDSPPGTGDEPLTVLQIVEGIDGALIVTTPQDVAASDVSRSISFVKAMNKPLIGLVENMSYFICPSCKEKHSIFGEGGGDALAKKYGIELLGKIPMEKELMNSSDNGKPYIISHPESEASVVYSKIAERILEKTNEK